MASLSCPCGSNQLYLQCCGPYLTGTASPPTPEALMRSRYTAFARRKFAYLIQTMHGEAAQAFNISAARRDAPFIKWLKLEVIHAEMGGNSGQVEFKATYRFQGKNAVSHELSRFEKIDDEWFYAGRINF